MDEIDWMRINDEQQDAWHRRVALVETLLDEAVTESERSEIRRAYQREHGVGERTIRNYLKRYRERGAAGLLFHRCGSRPPSPRIHDQTLSNKILSLIEERPRRTAKNNGRPRRSTPADDPSISSRHRPPWS